jgi:hypothetical protein
MLRLRVGRQSPQIFLAIGCEDHFGLSLAHDMSGAVAHDMSAFSSVR